MPPTPMLPADVQAAVRRRVRGLNHEVQELLQVAAVVGLEFSVALVAESAGLAEAEALDRTERARDAGLVEQLGIDRFRFTHALVRDHLVADLGISRRALDARRGIHRARHVHDLDEHLRTLAHHTPTPARHAEADDRARRSAERSLRLLASSAAVEDNAFASTPRSGRRPPADSSCSPKGNAERLAAYHTAALAACASAAALVATMATGRRSSVPRWRSRTPRARRPARVARRSSFSRRPPSTLATLRRATAVLVQASLAQALHYAGRLDVGRSLAEQALAESGQMDDAGLLAHTLLTPSVQARVPLTLDDLPVIVARADRCWQLLGTLVDPVPLSSAQ